MDLIKRSTPRKIIFTPGINPYADGSVLAEFGKTKVHITATIEPEVPRWLKGQGKGWVSAEYAMLPSSTHTRSRRERKSISGRSQEIQRLIGRSLRAVVDLKSLGEKAIMVDCDVLVADGGTRTASISGGYVALALAVKKLLEKGEIQKNCLIQGLGAISVGLNSEGKAIADLNYEEDSSCQADVNIVMTDSFQFIEVQGTAEDGPFSADQFQSLLSCAQTALGEVFSAQKKALGEI